MEISKQLQHSFGLQDEFTEYCVSVLFYSTVEQQKPLNFKNSPQTEIRKYESGSVNVLSILKMLHKY